jgi:NTP pyrophosphatase (non-canonical NTP hydrolase)
MTPTFSAVLFDRILAAGYPVASLPGVARRLMKNQEELGEVAEAFLNLTDGINSKGKTPEDLFEEVADVFLVTTSALQQFSAHLAVSDATAALQLTRNAKCQLDAVAHIQDADSFINVFAALSKAQGAAFELTVKGLVAQGNGNLDDELAVLLLEMHRFSSLLLVTDYPGMPYRTLAELKGGVLGEIDRKIQKWIRVRGAGLALAA